MFSNAVQLSWLLSSNANQTRHLSIQSLKSPLCSDWNRSCSKVKRLKLIDSLRLFKISLLKLQSCASRTECWFCAIYLIVSGHLLLLRQKFSEPWPQRSRTRSLANDFTEQFLSHSRQSLPRKLLMTEIALAMSSWPTLSYSLASQSMNRKWLMSKYQSLPKRVFNFKDQIFTCVWLRISATIQHLVTRKKPLSILRRLSTT